MPHSNTPPKDLEDRTLLIETVTTLRTMKETLLGNGQPGVISKHDARIKRLEWFSAMLIGGGFVVGMIIKALH